MAVSDRSEGLSLGPGPEGRLLGHGLEAVTDAVARLDERVLRRARVDLLAQPPDADVHGAVAVRRPAAPDSLQQLVAARNAAAVLRERVEEPELGRCQLGALVVDEGLHRARVDPQLLDHQLFAAVLVQPPDAA